MYTIKTANLNDEKTESALRHLIKAAFKSPALLPSNYLIGNIESNASEPSFFLVAKDGEQIVGCNGFLANDFFLNGNRYVGYQSCWSATHPDYRGKGVFRGIINEAKRILKNSGAGFIYGIPNDDSLPVFIKKLGFVEIPAVVVRIPNIPFNKYLYLKKSHTDKDGVCSIDEKQIQQHKIAQYPLEVKSFEYKNSWVWGKLIKKVKFGIKFPVFYIGGVHLADENDLKFLLAKIFKTHRVLFIQIFSCTTNSFNVLIKGWQRSKMNDFIFYNLNMPESEHFNIMIGAIDVF